MGGQTGNEVVRPGPPQCMAFTPFCVKYPQRGDLDRSRTISPFQWWQVHYDVRLAPSTRGSPAQNALIGESFQPRGSIRYEWREEDQIRGWTSLEGELSQYKFQARVCIESNSTPEGHGSVGPADRLRKRRSL